MAKKHFDAYFQKVANDYHELLLELNDMNKEFEEGLVSAEVYEQMKSIIEPIKRNYETLNYIDYLLNLPVRKSKHSTYKNQHRKQLNQCITDKEVLSENDSAKKELRNLF